LSYTNKSSGVYIYRFEVDGELQTGRLVV